MFKSLEQTVYLLLLKNCHTLVVQAHQSKTVQILRSLIMFRIYGNISFLDHMYLIPSVLKLTLEIGVCICCLTGV